MKIRPSIFFRTVRRKIGKFLLDHETKYKKDYSFKNIQKILFVRYEGKIGDYIVSSFIFREVKKQRPDIQIDIIVQESTASFCQKNPYIDNVFVLKDKSYAEIIRTSRMLSRFQYDVLIDSSLNLDNKEFLFIKNIAAKINVGYNKEKYKFFKYSVPLRNSNLRTHIREICGELLELIGFSNIDMQYEIPSDPKSEKNVAIFFREKIEKPFYKPSIAINLFGDAPNRKFNATKSLELIQLLRELFPNYNIIILTYPAVTSFVLTLIQRIDSKEVITYEQTEKIEDSIAIIKRVNFVVTLDTSIVHISDGLNKPLLTFYDQNEKNYAEWHSINPKTKLVRYTGNINTISMDEIRQQLLQMKNN
jgi:ADP-heptose:LPS heptosyltransferase